jgi:hypothetical protein
MRSVSATAAKNINLKKGASLVLQQPVQWRKTIADVQLDDPVCYCADVQNWAAATLEDAVKIDAM